MKKLMILFGLVVMLTGCSSQQGRNNEQENQESLVQEDEKDYEHLQEMVNYYDDIVDDGLAYAVKNLAKFVSDCEDKCQSLYMTYEDSLELVETQAYDEWFDKNYEKPIPNTTPLNSLASVRMGWGRAIGEGNSGLYQVHFNITNESYTHSIKSLEVEVSYEYDKQKVRDTYYLEVSMPSRTSDVFEYINLVHEPFDLDCKVISVEWIKE